MIFLFLLLPDADNWFTGLMTSDIGDRLFEVDTSQSDGWPIALGATMA